MADAGDDEPRSFRLSRGSSDVGLLFAALGLGLLLIIAPGAWPWVMRAGLLLAAILMLGYIRSVRRLILAGAWTRPPGDAIGTLIALGVLGFWVWYLARGFLYGNWIDAGLGSILMVEITYLEWLKRRARPEEQAGT